MLLVTFHGGSKGINNIYAYNSDGTVASKAALEQPKQGTLSELRAMVLANGLLYVANGAKSESTVLAYEVPRSGTQFENAGTLIGPTLSKKGHFETSIAHPFGIVFENAATCYISNQDTNVVSQVDVTGGSLGAVSPYLKDLFPTGTFLSGTYVASQVGSLPDVNVLTTAVDHVHGGLGVSFDSSGKVQNSVRDVAIANGILFVCDEPEKVVDLYALADGRYLGSSNALSTSPTHLATNNGGLYVSAGSNLYWGPLPQSASAASISLQAVSLTPPSSKDPLKIGGLFRRSLHGLHSISGRDRRQQEGGRIDPWLQRELAKSTSPDRRYRVRRLTAGHAGIRTLLAWQLTSPDTTHRPNWQRW